MKKKLHHKLHPDIAAAQLAAIQRQEIERAKFIAGEGIVIRRYNKDALKEQLKYIRKNRRQLPIS